MSNVTKIKSGIIWNSVHQLCGMGITLISIVVLSRLLSPTDYGLYGVMMIFISLSDLFIDSGMSGYVIKKQNSCREDFDTLFVYNMCLSILIYLLIYAVAPVVSAFYHEGILKNAIRVLGLVIIGFAFANSQNAIMLKELKFRALAIISLGAGFGSLTIAIILAWNGAGLWALISQKICYDMLTVVGLILCSSYRPSLRFKMSLFKEQLAFGINLLFSNILNTASSNLSNNVIGKAFSINMTGFYSQASKLSSYPVSMCTNVVDRTFFPIFSKMNRNLRELYLESRKTKMILFLLLFPSFTFLICIARYIVLVALGVKWAYCIPLFQYLMIGSFPALGRAINRSLMKSLGFTSGILIMEVFSAIVLFAILPFAILYHSINLLLLAYVAMNFTAFGISSWIISHRTGWSFPLQIKDFMKYIPIVCSIFIALQQTDSLAVKAVMFLSIFFLSLIFYGKLGDDASIYVLNKVKKTIYELQKDKP